MAKACRGRSARSAWWTSHHFKTTITDGSDRRGNTSEDSQKNASKERQRRKG